MLIVGAILIVMVISSAVVVAACMLSSQGNRRDEQGQSASMEMNGQWSGTSFGGKYATNIPHFGFEPEDLENTQGTRRF
jgi:hypothetical protein